MFKRPRELDCRPVLKDVICAFGEKCFHNIHYICRTTDGDCIPSDACPFNAMVNNLEIKSVTRSGGNVRIRGKYDLFIWFRYNGQRMIGQAQRLNVPFSVEIPLFSVNDGCREIVCEGGHVLGTEVCALNTRLEVVEAVVERDSKKKKGKDHCRHDQAETMEVEVEVLDVEEMGVEKEDSEENLTRHKKDQDGVCPGCSVRLRVVVEKIFQAFEHGPQVICIPACDTEFCPPTTESPECPKPFVRPTKCPEFCVQDEADDKGRLLEDTESDLD